MKCAIPRWVIAAFAIIGNFAYWLEAQRLQSSISKIELLKKVSQQWSL
jgi:hypothetical protein